MSFFDLPIVDENSKISEDSVHAVRGFFNRKSGFLLRIDDPDYGCDLTLELIENVSNASGKRFPAQIKSSGNLSIIQQEGKSFVTLPFSTSRLGYLCNHAPSYGLILVYDDSANICYFDYVESLVNRLTEEKGNQEWKNQKTATIHLPQKNILNKESVKEIHQTFSRRFDAHATLLQRYGADFNIPTFSNIKLDDSIKNVSAAELLIKYGMILLNDHDILRLFQLLAEVSFHEINSSKELLLIAAVVYSEIGKCIEGEFYLNKADQIIELFTLEEKEILKFTRIKVDFLLGKRGRQQFHDDLKNMQAVTQNPKNALQIQINLYHYSILDHIERNDFDEGLEEELLQFFQTIQQADLPSAHRELFMVYHAQNVHMFTSSKILSYISRLRVRESLGELVSQRERIEAMEKTNKGIYFFTNIVLEALQYARKSEDRFLKAHSHYTLSHFYFTKEYDFMLLDFKDPNPLLQDNYRRAYLQALEAHNLFLSLGLLKEARMALLNAYELSRLAKIWHQLDITSTVDEEETLLRNIKASEKEMGIGQPYQSIVDKVINNLPKHEKKKGQEFMGMTDEQIKVFAKTVLEIDRLPCERLIHVINEIKAYRYFQENCDTEHFELLCNLAPHQSRKTKYASPTSFIMVSKRTGLKSLPEINIETLSKSFGALKKRS